MQEVTVLKNKYFLYATEFFGGMSVMAVELGASRFLAPYFSSSQIVWTIIIGVIMIAMALGNLWGGRSADKNPNPSLLYRRLLIAALWIACIPLFGKYMIAFISAVVGWFLSSHFLIWASLFSCTVLFVPPLLLLGTITPCLVKYTVEDLSNNGAIVGKLGALQTVGSILGTFLPTFFTIPQFGTKMTFLIFSAILGLLSLIYFISAKRNRAFASAVMIAIVATGALSSNISYAFGGEPTYEGESIYNYLRVEENDREVILSTHIFAGVQSVWRKQGIFSGMYYDTAFAAPYMTESPKKTLIIGLGSGTYANLLQQYFPDMEITGVEVDEEIVRLARKYFHLSPSVKAVVEDGRAYLKKAEKYHVIMVDAYQDITIPFQLSSREFFSELKEHLLPEGILVINLNMKSGRKDSLEYHLLDTVGSVFSKVYLADAGGNTEVFAGDGKDIIEVLEKNAVELGKRDKEAGEVLLNTWKHLEKYTPKDRILTDDRAPVELLGIRVLDDIIQKEIRSFKEENNIHTLKDIWALWKQR